MPVVVACFKWVVDEAYIRRGAGGAPADADRAGAVPGRAREAGVRERGRERGRRSGLPDGGEEQDPHRRRFTCIRRRGPALHLRRQGMAVAGIENDTMVMSYLLFPNRRAHQLKELSAEFLGGRPAI